MRAKTLTVVPVFAVTVFTVALTACSQKNSEQVSEKPTGVIPQAQLDALNKAKNVDTALMQGEQQRREQSEATQ